MWDTASPGLPPALSVPMGQIEDSFRRLCGLVRDMTQEEVDYRGPDGGQNSAGMLLRHLSVVDLGYLYAIMGKPVPPALESAYGAYHDESGRIPVIQGRPATELLAEYSRVIDMVREYLQTQSDDEATREMKIPWWSQPSTVRFVLWHMAAHSLFHQGHISRLKLSYAQSG